MRDSDKLLCVDLICHGVPSQKVWKKYVDFRENRAGAPARRTFSRHKKYGWKRFALLFEFSNNKAYQQIFSEDLFMQAFLRNVCIRPSCHACPFKKLNRVSDITIADFWGIENVAPDMDDDKGTSLVLIHSKKGEQAFAGLSGKMCAKPVDTVAALAGNSAMTQAVPPHKDRERFFAHVDDVPFDKLVRRYARPGEAEVIKQYLKNMLKAVGILPAVKCILKRVRRSH